MDLPHLILERNMQEWLWSLSQTPSPARTLENRHCACVIPSSFPPFPHPGTVPSPPASALSRWAKQPPPAGRRAAHPGAPAAIQRHQEPRSKGGNQEKIRAKGNTMGGQRLTRTSRGTEAASSGRVQPTWCGAAGLRTALCKKVLLRKG